MEETTINPRRMPYVIVWEAIGGLRPYPGSKNDGHSNRRDSVVVSGFLAHEPAARRLAELHTMPYRRVLDTQGFDPATIRQRERRARQRAGRHG